MSESFGRMRAVFMRYLYLHKRSVSRALEMVFWPVMELLVWGFVVVYIRQMATGPLGQGIVFLISGIIFWDLLYRSQQGVSISFVEDIWTQNILNVLISPLKVWEWLVATFVYGFLKVMIIAALLSFLAVLLYQFNMMDTFGFALIPMVANLLFFGWSLGIFTSGLLIRFGHSVEALIWGIPFLIQPFSAIYYPVSILPHWCQVVSRFLPSTYVFEGMREVVGGGKFATYSFLMALGLNAAYFLLASLFFNWMINQSRKVGRLGRLGLD